MQIESQEFIAESRFIPQNTWWEIVTSLLQCNGSSALDLAKFHVHTYGMSCWDHQRKIGRLKKQNKKEYVIYVKMRYINDIWFIYMDTIDSFISNYKCVSKTLWLFRLNLLHLQLLHLQLLHFRCNKNELLKFYSVSDSRFQSLHLCN